MMAKTYTQQFAESMTQWDFKDLSAEVVQKAKLLVLDFLGATTAGTITPTAAIVQRALGSEMGSGPCWIVGRENRRTSPLWAAFLNGFNAHIVEYDDTHRNSLYHPGAPTVPAALAAVQMIRGTGTKLIEGLVAGYEMGIRLAESINPAHYAFWHTTGTVGCLGASAAAGKILGLSVDQLVWAFGNAGTQAAGLWEFQSDGSLTKPLHPGKAAQAGLLAALLAKEGFTGPSSILEGKQGFCKATASQFDLSRFVPKKGEPFRILEVTFKNYPSCGHSHTPIDAALELYPQVQAAGGRIESIRILTNRVAIRVAGILDPKTESEGKFSIPFCVAYALTHGRLDLDSFRPEGLSDPRVRELMSRIRMEVSEEMEKVFAQKRPTEIQIRMENGETLSARVEYRRGDPENPLKEEEVKAKFRMLTAPILSSARILQWEKACDRIEQCADMTKFPNQF